MRVAMLAVLGLVACAAPIAPAPVKVSVACDRTGAFAFALPLDGSATLIKTPACDAQCSSCGQECTVQVVR